MGDLESQVVDCPIPIVSEDPYVQDPHRWRRYVDTFSVRPGVARMGKVRIPTWRMVPRPKTFRPMDWQRYLEFTEGLPLPTDAQIERYARAIPEEHSWYKRLGEGDCFAFGIHAGAWFDGRARTSTAEFGFLSYYWVNADGAMCRLWSKNPQQYQARTYRESVAITLEGMLPPELRELAVPVDRENYYKVPEFTQAMHAMRDEIGRRRVPSDNVAIF